ncbi:hypothetical protein PT974_09035 [Cladobotryum mycophilum]|uniref:SGNH hydrolase-type esterase domain-containing protein n=1 Tax=Cladobotryum mycophilum TaxID=491253 RepID=A0ABR0SG57_9HYPO
MAPVLQSLGQWTIVGLALVSSVQATAMPIQASVDTTKPDLRLMPLGASITMGWLSTDGNGYRKDLFDLLTGDGFNVDMVGSRHDGNMTDNRDEGWYGYRIKEVEDKAKLSVPQFLPNLFTINAGTNDLPLVRLPRATLILSTLIINLNATTEARVEQVNQVIRSLAKKKQQEHKRIVLVDMHSSAGPQKTDMADPTHPNDHGYQLMANLWFKGIKEAFSRGFIQHPQTLPSQ